jgi:hypothetical protein
MTQFYYVLCAIAALTNLGVLLGDALNLWRVAPTVGPLPRKLVRLGLATMGAGAVYAIILGAAGRWVPVGLPEIIAQAGMALLGGGLLWGAILRGMALDPEPERSRPRRRDPDAWSPLPVHRGRRH